MNNVCKYFEKIMSIPRPSGKEDKIANCLCEFAKARGLWFSKDKFHNVIIKKDNGSKKTIILQCHQDMVCVADAGVNKDFESDGIDWYVDGDYYKAHGTTLGADNGIGVAIILSILDEESKEFPNIEAVFTTQEETTMQGAINLNYDELKGKTLISLDGIKEGDLESSCAGMCNIELAKKLSEARLDAKDNIYELKIDGLLGGHSGDDIGKNRLNAIDLLFRLLKGLNATGIVSIEAGKSNNVIPSFANAIFITKLSENEVNKICNDFECLSEEGGNTPKIYCSLKGAQGKAYELEGATELITTFNHGMIVGNSDGFPILSENMGAITLKDDTLKIALSIRSSDIKLENKQLEIIEKLSKDNGFDFDLVLRKPASPFKEDSILRKSLAKTYKKLFSKDVEIKHIHACMEMGMFAKNIKDLDICTIAPNVYDIHTTSEKVSISSINRVYDWIVETLNDFNK